MSETIAGLLARNLRTATQAYAAGDQIAPCVLLWPDTDRLWASVMPELMKLLPELFILGGYAPASRTGPALWLRCVEARTIDVAPARDVTPIFYLPGVSREQLRAVEDCPAELSPLIELQFRGTTWLHVNGKEWTPYAFLVSGHGGLGLEVARDQATIDALASALRALLGTTLAELKGRLLDREFFNQMVAPDASGLLLRWLSDPEGFQKRCAEPEWKAFCQQSRADFHFDPEKDGPLKGARLLAERGSRWSEAWQRFAESPTNYTGLVERLRRAAPKEPTMFDSAEFWPHLNDAEEASLRKALNSLANVAPDQAIAAILQLEEQHRARRSHAWHRLGMSSLAAALGPLAQLAKMCASSPGGPTAETFAESYAAEGWKVDAAAIATMATCGSQESHSVVLVMVHTIYLPWLENTARHLQALVANSGHTVPKRAGLIQPATGRLVLFADGLRLDVAQTLASQLQAVGLGTTIDWDWSTIPSVTASAKPAASPIADLVQGGEAGDEFCTRLISTGQKLTQDRFLAALTGKGWQCLGAEETGDPAGSAWTECGSLDKRGHNEGWKLARSIDSEIRDLVSRISALLRAGWTEIHVVTDHGWLLLPGGLPKVELKSFLAEHRWGRCAAMKSEAQTTGPAFKWHWNQAVTIASPPGAGCFRAAMEYTHGGISLQEMVIPYLRVTSTNGPKGAARLQDVKWTGAKCRVSLVGDCSGVRVDIRGQQANSTTSFLVDRQARETTPEGKVTLFLEDDADLGKTAEIVLLDLHGSVIDFMPTKLGE